ncbi:hypothetical protein ACIOG8_10385 [Streptomyces erythrochromogenes]|uniref:hypothetical protein n=1 Tax=Streptomyces erythrochromogenes TaxID=285574 RepID=UPI003823D207
MTTTAEKAKLAPTWTPKLDAAAENGVADCMTPSSNACAQAVADIMAVVKDLDAAITATGRRYPQTTAQIVKMQDAQKTYTDERCKGDAAADDPNSPCSRVVAVAVGRSTLQMTLITDDLS